MKKAIAMFLVLAICFSLTGIIPTTKARAEGHMIPVSLESMPIIDHGSYQGNVGDSTIFNLNGKGLSWCDEGERFNGYGNVGIDGTTYSNGFEAWIGRWNYTSEKSWAYATFDLGGIYKTLTGKTNLIESYNTTNFDTTLYFYDGDVLLASYHLTPTDYIYEISLNVTNVEQLTLYMCDNVAVCGGTSFALYDMFLIGGVYSNESNSVTATFNNHQYQIFDISLTWEGAKAYCENIGGHLATITSEEEQKFIEKIIENGSKNDYFLGGLNPVDDIIEWITSENTTYNNWNSDEPNDYSGYEEYLEIWSCNGLWNDTCNEELEGNGFLCEWDQNRETNDVLDNNDGLTVYFANFLQEGNRKDIPYVEMPCKTIIQNGGMPSLVWNTVLESIKSVGELKFGIDEKGYYEAILLDLLSNTATSVDYDKYMAEETCDMINKIADNVIQGNVDAAGEALDQSDLTNLWDNLQTYFVATDIQLTKEGYDALVQGIGNSTDYAESLATYATVYKEGKQLEKSLRCMAKVADYHVLRDSLNEMADIFSLTSDEVVKYVVEKKLKKTAYGIVGDIVLDGIIAVFPAFELVEEIMDIAGYVINTIIPTTTTSEEMYRIYTLNYIEDTIRIAYINAQNAYANNATLSNAQNLVSCYDMFVRVYEHEVAECLSLAEMIYKKGLLNGIKNFFSSKNMDEYQSAVDWIRSYNADLETIKGYKKNAYIQRGIYSGALQAVLWIGVVDGKYGGYHYQAVETGSKVDVPDYKSIQAKMDKFMNPLVKGIGTFEGWYYDKACTKPCMATSITASETVVLFAKYSLDDKKKLDINCPVDVQVFDDNGMLCAEVKSDVLIKKTDDDVQVSIVDSEKTIYLPVDKNYTVCILATDQGTMNYSVSEMQGGCLTSKTNFYDISLYNGQQFTAKINKNSVPSVNGYTLETQTVEGETTVINPDEIIDQDQMQALDVTIIAQGKGMVSNGILATKGDYFVATATPDNGQEFLGWYVDDILVSADEQYGFIVMESITITARFTDYTIDLGDLNSDEMVNAKDALEVLKAAVGKTQLTDAQKSAADVNKDGTINAKDALEILKKSVGKPACF